MLHLNRKMAYTFGAWTPHNGAEVRHVSNGFGHVGWQVRRCKTLAEDGAYCTKMAEVDKYIEENSK